MPGSSWPLIIGYPVLIFKNHRPSGPGNVGKLNGWSQQHWKAGATGRGNVGSCTHVIYPNHLGKLLLETGKVDVDFKNNWSRMPLWWAAEKGHEAVVKLLLETAIGTEEVEFDMSMTTCSLRFYNIYFSTSVVQSYAS
jgi:hypothetical protein